LTEIAAAHLEPFARLKCVVVLGPPKVWQFTDPFPSKLHAL
jgi:hypothetical protein